MAITTITDETVPTASAFANGYDDPGLTKREYFAAMMTQSIALRAQGDTDDEDFMQAIAEGGVKLADALIAELNKEPA